MSNQTLTKNYTAEGAITANSIVKFGTTDDVVVLAAAATDASIGVVEGVAPSAGERCDVVMSGIAEIKLAGSVTRGGPITANASGLGVAAAPGAGSNNRIVGFTLASGVSGDIVPVLLAQGSLQG